MPMITIDVPLMLSVFSLIVSIGSLAVAWQSNIKSTQPVLVFTRRSETEWQIENVGNGPALDPVVREMDSKGNWKPDIVRLYPIWK
jgi:hypothetical protein